MANAAPKVSLSAPRTLKIALVTETFPPEINGVAMTLGQLVEGMSERRHGVTVVRPKQSSSDRPRSDGLFQEMLCPGVPIPGYPLLRAGLPVRGRLLKAWRAAPPDVVHIATEGPLGYAALSAASALDLPVSSSFHTNFHAYSRDYGFAFLARPALAYLRHFHNRTRITLSPTIELNEDLARQGFLNLRLLSRGVDTRLFSPEKRSSELRSTWGAGPADLVVLHVSRVAAEKNYPLVLETFTAIRSAHPGAKFVLASDGPLRKKLQREHPWVRFTGFLSRNELAQHYASADLFPFASVTETFGNVVTEAMASGLPVVAFDYAAAARFLRHKASGWLVPFGDQASFVLAACEVAKASSLRAELRSAARLTAEGIPWAPVVSRFEQDLLEVAQTPVTSAMVSASKE